MTKPTCPACGTRVAPAKTGRPRVYCSDRCRNAAYRARSRAWWQDWFRGGDHELEVRPEFTSPGLQLVPREQRQTERPSIGGLSSGTCSPLNPERSDRIDYSLEDCRACNTFQDRTSTPKTFPNHRRIRLWSGELGLNACQIRLNLISLLAVHPCTANCCSQVRHDRGNRFHVEPLAIALRRVDRSLLELRVMHRPDEASKLTYVESHIASLLLFLR